MNFKNINLYIVQYFPHCFQVFLKVAEQTSEDDLPDEYKRKKLEDVTDGRLWI